MTTLTRYRKLYRSSTAQERAAGRLWYPAAQSTCKEIAADTGHDWRHIALAMAALSPQVQWDINIRLTIELAAGTLRGGTFRHAIDKAKAVLRTGEGHILGGRKVRSFAAALLGNRNAATIDTHMLRAAGHDIAFTKGRVEDCQRALYKLAIETGESIRDLQAIIWLVQRDNETVPF